MYKATTKNTDTNQNLVSRVFFLFGCYIHVLLFFNKDHNILFAWSPLTNSMVSKSALFGQSSGFDVI